MKKVKVNLGKRSYQILIGAGALSLLRSTLKKLNLGKVAIVVTNSTINRLYGRDLAKALKISGLEPNFVEVPDTEESKSAGECINLIEKFARLDMGRGVFVIAFGGGVIGDLAGFAASVYRRGIPYIQLPTTLLAQVDSSIGGKVAIDLPCGKNLIGSFYQPRLVLSDTRFLRSLKTAQIKEALSEIIKYAIISGKQFFEFLEKHLDSILKLNPAKLQYLIETCAKIKAKIVAEDEIDKKGKRIILNLGHTTAHAIEAASGFAANYSHGYAVGLGILVACELSKQLKLISAGTVERIATLVKRVGLPTEISGLKLGEILEAQTHDKKFSKGKNQFVLPVGIGKVIVKENIPQAIISKAIKSTMK